MLCKAVYVKGLLIITGRKMLTILNNAIWKNLFDRLDYFSLMNSIVNGIKQEVEEKGSVK